ncbi:MAG: hypothetical protein R8M45_07790 [Ghiorsea sp.]
MVIQDCLDNYCTELNLRWLTVVNSEGLTVCSSGIDERFELAALLPEWMDTSHKLATAASMEQGMGLICLVPKAGGYLLLMRDFEVKHQRMFLLMATPKIPPKSAKTLDEICQTLRNAL